MNAVFNPASISMMTPSLLALSRQLLDVKEQDFEVPLKDGVFTIKAKWLMVNIFMWRPLVRQGLPIEKRHTMMDGLVTTDTLAVIQTQIYIDVVAHHTDSDGAVSRKIVSDILLDLTESMNDLHTMIATQLGRYHLSISAFELADLLLDERIVKLTEIDVEKELKIGIDAVENKMLEQSRLLINTLKDNTLPSNVLAPFVELGQLNVKQLSAVIYCLGYRTDSDANMVRRPILTSYIKGYRDILDYATDSLAAKKSIYYNADAMPGSQYNNRIQQLLSNVIWHLYNRDCGSTLTVSYYVHKDNYKNIVHKNIVEDGKIVLITPQSVKSYIGKTVAFRSPLTCRHTDGVCRICGGHLTDFMPAQTVLGITCTVEYISTASQLVLSAKHFSATRVVAYTVPEALREILVVKRNDIYIKDNVDVNRIKIGLVLQDVPYINELKYLDKEKITVVEDDDTDTDDGDDKVPIMEQQFSSIRYVVFYDAITNEPLTPEVSMANADGTVPYLSSEFLLYLRDNFKNIDITDNLVTISLRHFNNVADAIFGYVVMSSSMLNFNKNLSKFFTKNIREYTSLEHTLRDFSSLVYSEIQVNIFHLEVVLKSYLITDAVNYNIPVVSDPDNVKFGTLFTLMPRRSLGSVYAYQRLAEYMRNPEWYTQPHKQGIFDLFFYPQD